MTKKNYQFIYIAAGAINLLGVLIFSRAFTNANIVSWNPGVFSLTGSLSIMLWGLAYIAASFRYPKLRALTGVFALEKVAYTATWILFVVKNWTAFPRWIETDPMTGLFLLCYGANDFVFAVLFGFVTIQLMKNRKE